jgi:hypothetical protein
MRDRLSAPPGFAQGQQQDELQRRLSFSVEALVRNDDPEAAAAIRSHTELKSPDYRRSVLLSHLWFAYLLIPLLYDSFTVPFAVCILYRAGRVHWALIMSDIGTGMCYPFSLPAAALFIESS